MSVITLDDRKFVKYLSEEQIIEAINRVAEEINEEYKNDIPIVVFILNGSIVFGAELLKRLKINCRVSCMRVSSYEGVQSTAKVKNLIGLVENIENQRILIVEDIIDTGNTYEYIHNTLMESKIKDVKIATMTYKPESYKKDLPIDFIGLEIPNKFIVGHGLDYNGLGRNLADIYQVVEE